MTNRAVFIRVVDTPPDQKEAALRQAVGAGKESAASNRLFFVQLPIFQSIPTSPFAYWAPETVLRAFKEHPRYESGERTALQGASTCDDFRYVRTWYEVRRDVVRPHGSGPSWVGFARGGRFNKFYAPVPALVLWDANRTTFHGFIGRSGRWNPKPVSADHYLQPALTWPLRGIVFSVSALPSGCAYSVGGKVALAPPADLLSLLAIFNSSVFNAAISLFAGKVGGFQYETGIINAAPVPQLDAALQVDLASLARRAWSLRRSLDTRTETSHAFVLPAALQVGGDTLAERVATWAERVQHIEGELVRIQAEIDKRCFDIYGITEVDRRAICDGFGSANGNPDDRADSPSDDDGEAEDDEAEDDEAEDAAVDEGILAADLVSWAVGVAVGRFDVRLAIGDRSLQVEPEPFDPLPTCSPAMLTGADGFALSTAPAGYPNVFPETGILVDDPSQPRDLTAAIRAAFDTVFGTSADAWWSELGARLDPKDHDLRGWIASSFFEHHLKRHSKSRRKAPTVWQLGIPSRRYSVWLYAHRLTRDSFFQLQNDVVAPKLAHEERQLASLVQSTGGNPSAKERKAIAVHAAFVEELRMLLDEVKRVTPMWNPILDDGVVLAMAPLWRLVPQHKPWQKELKGKWDELVAAKYDWAHLAMHLWPERVVPKCATDRSLAIAHGLEDVFWVEGTVGKWKPRPTPTRPVPEIVRERTSAAVKAALKSFLEAPSATTGGTRVRVRRTASAAAD